MSVVCASIPVGLLLAAGDGGAPSLVDSHVDLALWTLFIFIGLLLVLWKFAWNPILDGLDAREKRISESIDNAANAELAAQAELKQYREKIAGAETEAAAIIAEARKDAGLVKERILADAAEEAQRTRERALAEIQAAKDAVVRELAESSVNSAVSLAGSLVGRSLNKQDHSDLIQKSLAQFGNSA